MKPVATPITLAVWFKMHCFVALQLKQVNTSVVTEDIIVFRDQIDHMRPDIRKRYSNKESCAITINNVPAARLSFPFHMSDKAKNGAIIVVTPHASANKNSTITNIKPPKLNIASNIKTT